MNSHSLKIALILPYVLLVSVAALALGGASYWASNRSITVFSGQLMHEVVARISQAVHSHVHGSGAVLEAAFPDGMPVGKDIGPELEELRTRFWIATSMYTNPNDYVYYGNEQGQGFGLKRRGPQEAELRVKLKADEHRGYYRFTGIRGKPEFLSREKALFDPRTRVWYQLAQQTDRHTWTAVYIDFSSRDLVVTRARRVLATDGSFAGVVATDVSLLALNRFIASLDVGEHGRAFIVERDGKLVAASGIANVGTRHDGGVVRVGVDDSGDATLKAAYASIVPMFGAANADDKVYQVTTTDAHGGTVAVAAQRIVDDAGLDWIAVVAVPRAAILAGINQQIWVALAIGLLAVLVAVLVGMRIFGRIAHDIAALSSAVDRIRQGALDVPIDIQRRDEVGELARNFKAMHADLFTDKLTGAANRTALASLLASATRAPGNRPFTLFFIDLNRFKPLNDHYGHDNGDRALAEVARRLQVCLRPDDFIARLGGDEFVVVAPDATAPEAVSTMVVKLTSVVEAPLQNLQDIPPGTEVTLGAAIGHARWPEDAADPDELLKRADEAMYRNKGAAARER
jgi:diguanylate cyclase (GGDEF)-like protein